MPFLSGHFSEISGGRGVVLAHLILTVLKVNLSSGPSGA